MRDARQAKPGPRTTVGSEMAAPRWIWDLRKRSQMAMILGPAPQQETGAVRTKSPMSMVKGSGSG